MISFIFRQIIHFLKCVIRVRKMMWWFFLFHKLNFLFAYLNYILPSTFYISKRCYGNCVIFMSYSCSLCLLCLVRIMLDHQQYHGRSRWPEITTINTCLYSFTNNKGNMFDNSLRGYYILIRRPGQETVYHLPEICNVKIWCKFQITHEAILLTDVFRNLCMNKQSRELYYTGHNHQSMP